jgi:hypothetical protein
MAKDPDFSNQGLLLLVADYPGLRGIIHVGWQEGMSEEKGQSR